MLTEYFGQIEFADAVARQARVAPDFLLGFEPASPVITLGTRGRAEDDVLERVWPVLRVDRGGQATLHNPGQLVIFPVVRLRRGARAFVRALGTATVRLGHELGAELHYDEARPGVYDTHGAKVAAVGLRIRGGVTSHGLAINLRNDLAAFARIRACGVSAAPVAHLQSDLGAQEIFARWALHLNDEVDKAAVPIEC